MGYNTSREIGHPDEHAECDRLRELALDTEYSTADERAEARAELKRYHGLSDEDIDRG